MTDCGRRRAQNEDALLADERLGLFLVCDGVGGRAFGEVAAAETAAIVHDQISQAVSEDALRGAAWTTADRVERAGAIVRAAMQEASRSIHEQATANPIYRGMSTMATVVLVVDGCAVVGHVGDSRAYHARGDMVRQLTQDHTLLNLRVLQGTVSAEEARGRKSSITRAIGLRDTVEVDIVVTPLQAGDRLLLCTDGLYEYFDEDAVLARLFGMDVRDAAIAAVHFANMQGGKDNITALFVEVVGDS